MARAGSRERLTVILAIDREGDVANSSVTEYRVDPAQGRDGGLSLVRYNSVPHLDRSGAAVIAEPDRAGGVRG